MAEISPAPIQSTPAEAQPTAQPSQVEQGITEAREAQNTLGLSARYELDDGTAYRVFSTDQVRKPPEHFNAVFEKYKEPLPKQKGLMSKVQTPGFSVVPDGSLQSNLLMAFNKVMTPIQEKFVAPLRKDIDDPGVRGAATRGFLGPGALLVNQLEAVKTPGGLGATAALTAVGATPIKNMTGSIPSIVKGLSAAAGYTLGTEATGGDASLSITEKAKKSLLIGATVAAADGAVSLLKHVFGMSLSQEASKKAHDGIMDVMRAKYPDLLNSGVAGQNAMMSTRAGVQAVTQKGIQAFKLDRNNAMLTFADQLNKILPPTFDRAVFKRIQPFIKDYNAASHKYLDNLDKPAVQSTAQVAMKKASDAIEMDIKVELARIYPNMSPQGKMLNVVKLQELMKKHKEAEGVFMGAAEVLASLKKAGQAKGFNAAEIQKEMSDKYLGKGEMYKDVALASSRTDKINPNGLKLDKELSFRLGIPGTRNMPILKHVGTDVKVGTKYTGSVPKVNVSLPLNMAIINQYLHRDKTEVEPK